MWKIDYDYQYEFAKSARENDVHTYVLVSSDFASQNSRYFYSRMKGLLEEAVRALGFAKLTIFKPPLLIRKDSDRALEVALLKVIQFLNKIGIFRSQRPLQKEILAQAMINSAKQKNYGISSFRGKAIREFADTDAPDI